MIDFLDSNKYEWTNEKISSYEKWKESAKKGIIDFIEDDDYEEFEKRFLKEIELEEETKQETKQETEEETEEELDINIKNIVVNKENKKYNNNERIFSLWLFFCVICGLISGFLKENWSLIKSNNNYIKLTKFVDNNIFLKFQKKENNKKRL